MHVGPGWSLLLVLVKIGGPEGFVLFGGYGNLASAEDILGLSGCLRLRYLDMPPHDGLLLYHHWPTSSVWDLTIPIALGQIVPHGTPIYTLSLFSFSDNLGFSVYSSTLCSACAALISSLVTCPLPR